MDMGQQLPNLLHRAGAGALPLGSLRDRGRLSPVHHQCLQTEPLRSTDPLGKKVFTTRGADIPTMAGTYSNFYKIAITSLRSTQGIQTMADLPGSAPGVQ